MWSNLVPVIQEYFAKDELQTVSLEEWLEILEASGQMPDADATQNPGLKLLDMLQGLKNTGGTVFIDTKLTQERSKTMQSLQPVNKDWMRLWLEQWAF
jgi:hypothetical protein